MVANKTSLENLKSSFINGLTRFIQGWKNYRTNLSKNWFEALILSLSFLVLYVIFIELVRLRTKGYIWASGFEGKTFFDWLELLVIPLLLAIVAIWFNWNQKKTELVIAEKEREKDRYIADDHHKEEALQTYINLMGEMLHKEKLLETKDDPFSSLRFVAQVQTVTTLRKLDPDRQNILFAFLFDSRLAYFLLSDAFMQKITVKADLSGINLSGANLFRSKLNIFGRSIDFFEASLVESDLSYSDLRHSKLDSANLRDANLYHTDLVECNFTNASLVGARLVGAFLKKSVFCKADLQLADLSNTDCLYADFSSAILCRANMRGATLNGCNLIGANLLLADLSGASLLDAKVTEEQLSQTTSLKGATMPDGTVHN
jgi:uncharacterized protein YjbI with pentapeptide repeats